MLGQRAPACGYLTLWGETPSLLICSSLWSCHCPSPLPLPLQLLHSVLPFSLLQFWSTNSGTHQRHICFLYCPTWPTHVVCQQTKRSCIVYACAGEREAINITPVTAHQLMFITYHTQHLKKETTFHLCLEQRQLQKLSQLEWSLIKLRRFIWLSALGGRRSSQNSLSVILSAVSLGLVTETALWI